MKFALVILMLTSTMISFSQDLEKHQWKNRVLLVYSDSLESENFKTQIQFFSDEKAGLKERKLIIYQLYKDKYSSNFNSVWHQSNLSLKKYVSKNEGFKVILIGLDGGVKLAQKTILTTEKLFSIIDGMPMRKRELKNKD